MILKNHYQVKLILRKDIKILKEQKEEIKLQSIDTLKTKQKSKLKTEIDLASSTQEIESPKKTTIKSVKSVKSTKSVKNDRFLTVFQSLFNLG